MRAFLRTRRVLAAAIATFVAITFVACSDSNDVTGPAGGSFVDLSGDWNGNYLSDAPSLCTGGSASASFTQNGREVSGTFRALGCGISGSFRGTVDGQTLTGRVNMIGCTGGGLTARLEAGALTFTVGDFHKDLVAGDAEVLPGGQGRLQR